MKTTTLLTTTLLAALLFAAATTPAQPVSNTMPVITLGAPDMNANESGDPGRFVLMRHGPTNDPVQVFLLIGGTASNGVDYASIPNWQTIPAGVRERGIMVEPLVDTITEGPETVGLKLIPPPTGIPTSGYIIGTSNAVVVTIFENAVNPPPTNVPVVTVRTVDPEAVEPAPGQLPNPGVFRVFRDGPTNHALNVHLRLSGMASNGVDYVSVSNSVVIPAGVRGAEVVIKPLADNLVEPTERVVIRLEDVVSPAIFPPVPGTYVVGMPREAALDIVDRSQTNHPPCARIVKPFDGQMFLPGANIPIVVDTVDRDGFCRRVEFFADGDSIGVREKHFITPPPPGEHIGYELVWSNAPSGRHVLSARATDDDGASSWAEPVCVWVASTNSDPCVTIKAADPIAAEGTNYVIWSGTNETAVTNIRPINTALFVIRRSGPTNEALTVHYHIGGTASNGVDYLELPGAVTIPAGRRAAEVRVVPIDDAAPEPIETVRLGLRVPPTASILPPPYCVGWPGRAGAVIVDNDGPRPPTGHLPDRTFHVAMGGEHGQWFRIECSDDGVRWQVVCVTQVVDGGVYFLDPDADELPSRFYRCIPTSPPPPE